MYDTSLQDLAHFEPKYELADSCFFDQVGGSLDQLWTSSLEPTDLFDESPHLIAN